jgi:opacity protein-like surface antigen
MKRITIALLAAVVGAGLMSSAYAADLIIEEPAEVGVVDVGGDWDGLYIGAHVGYGWGTADHTSGPGFNDMDLSGWLAGVQLGANFTVTDGIVAGIEGDISWSGIGGVCDITCNTVGITHDIDWVGSLRGRLGFDGGAFMPYVTAGVAFASATRDAPNLAPADTQTHVGWTAGAGVEFMAAENVSLNLEWRYTDLGEAEYDTGGIPPTIDLQFHQIRAGLNWHF